MNSPDQHIADQPELIEDYLLGRLGKASADAIVQHLRTCSRCSDAVAAEKRLIAAIRRSGRDTMKERLRASLDTDEATLHYAVPWPRILAAAATVVILIGFGLAGRWLFLHYGVQEQVSEQAARSVTNEPEVSSQDSHERTESAAPPQKQDQANESRVREPARAQSEATGNVKGLEQRGGGLQAQEVQAPALAEQDKEKKAVPVPAAQEYAKSILKDEQSASDALLRRDAPSAGVNQASVVHRPVVVSMRPATTGVSERQLMGRAMVQSMKSEADTAAINVTLYLSPRDSSYVHLTPVTRWITDDSLIVSVGDTTAGYRIPLTR